MHTYKKNNNFQMMSSFYEICYFKKCVKLSYEINIDVLLENQHLEIKFGKYICISPISYNYFLSNFQFK
jgi:hypothetical protein